MPAPEVHPAPKSTKHHGRAQVVIGGSARETQVLFFTETEAREWATTGKTAADPKPAALPTQPGPVQLQKPPAPDAQPAAAPADFLTDAWSTTAATAAPDPAPAADRDFLADAWSLKPSAPAADPGDNAAGATTATPLAKAAPVDDDRVVGLREAFENHLPGVTSLYALRTTRATDSTFPGHVGKRGSAFLYRLGDLKRWARNRPRAASGTTDLDRPTPPAHRSTREQALSGPADTIPPSWGTPGSPGTPQKRNTAPCGTRPRKAPSQSCCASPTRASASSFRRCPPPRFCSASAPTGSRSAPTWPPNRRTSWSAAPAAAARRTGDS
ncbi:hypothetical protein ACFTXM_32990 [Streptomyces sp. NPDC056930]|uniref:hypothetical protein n=1 Tax=Streptomyces sp. NPDC056930 TaxID=3345967 RepID=UPI00362D9247